MGAERTSRRRWSKLKKSIESLFDPNLDLQIYETAYTERTKFDTYTHSRHWVVLDGEIIWYFPSQFLAWKNATVGEPVEYLVSYSGLIANILDQYINCPEDKLQFCPNKDKWGLWLILLTAYRRLGKDCAFHISKESQLGAVHRVLNARRRKEGNNE